MSQLASWCNSVREGSGVSTLTSARPPTDRLQYCQSAYEPINSSLVDFSANRRSQFWSLPAKPFGSAGEPSDLRQRDLVGVRIALDVEDEGVFVGVMLDDVVVHVHQDPDARDTRKFNYMQSKPKHEAQNKMKSCSLPPHSPFFTFLVHFGHPLCGHAVLLRYLQMRYDITLWTGALPKTTCAFRLYSSVVIRKKKHQLTASIRPLSVGDFSIRASNTSSVSFLTYNSTAERKGRMKLHVWAAVFSLVFICLLASGEISFLFLWICGSLHLYGLARNYEKHHLQRLSAAILKVLFQSVFYQNIRNGNSLRFQHLSCEVLLYYMKYLLFFFLFVCFF